MSEEEDEERRLLLLEAVDLALVDPVRTLELIFSAADPDAALSALQEGFGIGREQASAIIDLQFRRATARDREAIRHSVAETREHLALVAPGTPLIRS